MRCARCSGCTSLGADLRRRRVHAAAWPLVIASVLALAACHSESADPTNTVGSIPIETTPTTLLPIVIDTAPPDVSTTLPAGLLFGGDLCSALTTNDFMQISIGALGTGELIDQVPLADDTCGYSVQLGRDEITIIVRARAASDAGTPGADGGAPEPVSGLGLAASMRVLADGTFDVIVQVDNGWFSVSSIDRESAIGFALRAVTRVAG